MVVAVRVIAGVGAATEGVSVSDFSLELGKREHNGVGSKITKITKFATGAGVAALAVVLSACGSGVAGPRTAVSTPPTSPSASPSAPTPALSPSAPTPALPAPAPSGTASGRPANSDATLLHAKVDTRADVPWGDVGPGWFLVVDDSTAALPDAKPGTQTLWLIAPTGDRYSIMSWQADASSPMLGAELVDWSPDGKRALAVSLTGGSGELIEVDLTSGTLRRATAQNVTAAVYTRPMGANIVIRTDVTGANGAVVGSTISRGVIVGDGKPFEVKATLLQGDGSVQGLVYSPDGATLYTGDRGSVLAISNAGGKAPLTPPVTLPVQPDAELCTPLSWWSPGTLLVTCAAAQGFRLWTVPVGGGSPAAMTAPPGSEGVGLGYSNAVRASGITLLQHPLGCGVEDIHRLGAGGVGTKLDVQGSLGNDHIVGTAGARVAVRSSTECEMPSWFGFVDVTTGATSIVLPGSAEHRGPGTALAFDR